MAIHLRLDSGEHLIPDRHGDQPDPEQASMEVNDGVVAVESVESDWKTVRILDTFACRDSSVTVA